MLKILSNEKTLSQIMKNSVENFITTDGAFTCNNIDN